MIEDTESNNLVIILPSFLTIILRHSVGVGVFVFVFSESNSICNKYLSIKETKYLNGLGGKLQMLTNILDYFFKIFIKKYI
jgi:hypothetical protein